MSWVKMVSPRSSKNGIHLWKKPVAHFFICFVLGFGIGLTPLQTNTSTTTGGTQPSTVIRTREGERKVSEQVQVDALDNNEMLPVTSGNTLSNSSSSAGEELNVENEQVSGSEDVEKLLLVVTPTHTRPFQDMYLTRLANTLKLVPTPLLWIVVEMREQSAETAALLRKTGVMYRHLACKQNLSKVEDRGAHQRNVALQHIERHQLDGIVYFADDDNFYSLDLFHQLREIKRFGTWPVAMLAHGESKTLVEGPVCEENRVIGWHTDERSEVLRRFHVNMAGFGFNSTILWDPRRWKRPTDDPIRLLDDVEEGFQETAFVEQLVEDESQMEGLPSSCSKIMVWHLHVELDSLSDTSG